MKIEVAREKLLSNFEVYNHLVDVQEENHWNFSKEVNNKNKFRANNLINLEIITKDLFSYLSKTGCIPDREIKFKPKHDRKKKIEKVTEEKVIPGKEEFIRAMIELNKFELEQIEKLQIVNKVPRNLVALYSVVEECDQRFTEDQCNSIIEIMDTYFFPKDVDEEQDQVEGDVSMMDVDKSQVAEEEEEEEEVDVDVEGLVDEDEDLQGESYARKKNDGELDEVQEE